jgi:ABC-type transport system involved in multi-copper enzyme maturation permease subunit
MKLKTIILNTFKEAVRGKLFIVIFGFSIVFLIASRIFLPLTLGEERKILMDIGLGSISIVGILLAILIGSQLVFNELEKKTVYFILSKPIRRRTFIIGKFLGLILTLFVVVSLLTVWFYLVLFWLTRLHPYTLLIAIFLSFLEISVVTAFSIFFSTFTSPILTSVFTFFFFVIGRLSPDIQLLATKVKGPISHFLLRVVYYTIPNLSNFNVRGKTVYAEPIGSDHILFAVSYALIYIVLLLFVSIEIFKRKDL